MAGMDKYFLTLGIKADDVNSLEKQEKLFKRIADLQKEINESQKFRTKEAKEQIKNDKKQIEAIQKILKVRSKEVDILKAFAKEGLQTAFTKSIDFFKEEFKAAWGELNKTLSFSQLTNSAVRDLKFTYGFSSSEAYGFQNALKTLGISENDLMYMNEQQSQQFQTLMSDFAERYTKLEASGFFTDLQTMNVEWAEFKQDLLMEFAQFFVENKDIIKAGFDDLLKITDAVLYIAGKINDILGGGQYSAGNSSDIIAKYAGTTTNNTTIKIDNSFTGKIDQSTQHSIAYDMTQSFEQIIKSLQ